MKSPDIARASLKLTGSRSTAIAPFGGVKESGRCREGSKYGVEDTPAVKYLCMGL
jgi:succinate-semialdehyde dehydrogenase/glutarate-semialdehyde dehydrogenase